MRGILFHIFYILIIYLFHIQFFSSSPCINMHRSIMASYIILTNIYALCTNRMTHTGFRKLLFLFRPINCISSTIFCIHYIPWNIHMVLFHLFGYIIVMAYSMMTSSNGNIFCVTGPLCGEFTGPGEFPIQRPVTRSFDVFFDLRLNKRLSKQPWGWWFEMPSWSLWRHCNACDLSIHIF